MGVLCVEHANVLKLCYIELLSGDGSYCECSPFILFGCRIHFIVDLQQLMRNIV